MLKLSRYNHFLPMGNGMYLAYNAYTGSVALMPDDKYSVYTKMSDKIAQNLNPEENEEEKELMRHLKFGGYVCSDDFSQREDMKFRHYRQRYDQANLGLVIAPTMACNMACTYCYESNKTGLMSPDTISATKEFVKKRIHHLNSLTIGWLGGEPLLAMDIIKDLSDYFIELAGKSSAQYSGSVITNGYLLTPENTDMLAVLKISNIQVTIDGPARLHNTKRPLKNGQSSFEQIIENIRYASKKISVRVRINVDKDFTNEILLELLNELTQAGLRDRISITLERIEPHTEVCSNIAESCYNASDFSQKEVVFYRTLFEQGFRIDKIPSPIEIFCLAQRVSSYVVDPKGELYRCNFHISNPEKSMGNIRDEINFENSMFLRMFSFDPFRDETCNDCSLLPICMGGCPSHRAERGLHGDQMCPSWKHNLQPMLEIVACDKQRQMQEQAMEQNKSDGRQKSTA